LAILVCKALWFRMQSHVPSNHSTYPGPYSSPEKATDDQITAVCEFWQGSH